MGIALGIASVASSVYGAHKQSEAAKAAGAAARGAAYEPPIDSYRDKGYDERREKQNNLYDKVGKGSEFRGDQRGLVDMLKEKSEGRGTSLAQNTLAQGIQDAQATALGSAAGVPGAAGGLGLRNLLGAQGALSMQGANQAAQLGLKEQDIATGRLGAAIQQGRQGDYNDNAQLLSILQQQGLEDHRNRQALVSREGTIAGGRQAAATGQSRALQAQGKAQANLWGGLGKGLGNAAASGLAGDADSAVGDWWNNRNGQVAGGNYSVTRDRTVAPRNTIMYDADGRRIGGGL